MKAWDFLVDRSDLSQTALRAAPDPDPEALADGEVLLEVERFALTSNNITYGVVGDRLGYWRFFAAPDGWGRIPVWGFARVIASRAFGVDAGLRLYGYWPMSTHLVTRLAPSESGFMDVAAHRSALPATYNRYEVAPTMRGDDHNALLRPLFTTAFLLDNYLAEIAPAATPVVSSASSRTAIGLAWLLVRRGVRPVALTSARNALFVEQLGLYSEVATYGALEAIGVERSVVFVDMAGEAAVRSRLQTH